MSAYLQSLCGIFEREVIKDLETMIKIPATQSGGGLGFPIMQTILSGMEFWGIVMSNGETNDKAFNYFWNELFIKDNPQYDKPNLSKIFRVSIRHGTAHYCVAKIGIVLSKIDSGNLTNKEGHLNIDVITFYNDFLKTYASIKEQIKTNTRGYKKGLETLVFNWKGAKDKIDELVKSLPSNLDIINKKTVSPNYDYEGSNLTGITPSFNKLNNN
jgi:hypothetical protein